MTAAAINLSEHPLENKWTFWEHRKSVQAKDAGKAYGSNMYELGTFETVEGFWRYKNNLPMPSDIFSVNSQGPKMKFPDREVEGYSLFKAGIRPEWEDEANKYGGEMFCRRYFEADQLNLLYEDLLLGLIGETVDPDDEICGCRIVDKSNRGKYMYRVEVWFRSQDMDKMDVIKKNLVNCLGVDILGEFRDHGQSAGAGRSGGRF